MGACTPMEAEATRTRPAAVASTHALRGAPAGLGHWSVDPQRANRRLWPAGTASAFGDRSDEGSDHDHEADRHEDRHERPEVVGVHRKPPGWNLLTQYVPH